MQHMHYLKHMIDFLMNFKDVIVRSMNLSEKSVTKISKALFV